MKTEWTASVCQHCLSLQDMILTVQQNLHPHLVIRSRIRILVTAYTDCLSLLMFCVDSVHFCSLHLDTFAAETLEESVFFIDSMVQFVVARTGKG